jgi:hypothetical protein
MLSFEQRTSNVLFVVASTREKENWVIFCVMCQGHIRVPVPLGETIRPIAASSISTGVRTKGRNFVFNR